MDAVRIALVDDHPPVLRGAIHALEAALPVATAVTTCSVGELLATRGPYDVVILDLQLDDGSDPTSNVEAIVERGWPVLIYTQTTHVRLVGRCFRAGASGIVAKRDELSTLVEAVALVAEGQPFLSGDWAGALEADAGAIPHLAPREFEALRLYAAGLPLKSVARRMGISPETVKDHLMRVRRRYQEVGRPAVTKTDLYIRAVEDGLLPSASRSPPPRSTPRGSPSSRTVSWGSSCCSPSRNGVPRPARSSGCAFTWGWRSS